MKTSVSSYSFGRLVREWGIEKCIRFASEEGFDGIEFVDGDLICEKDELVKVRTICENYGIEPVAMLVSADFLNNEDEERSVMKKLDCAKYLGVSLFRHDVTNGFRKDVRLRRSFSDAVNIVAERISRVSDYASALGIRTMSENHGLFCQGADRMELLVNAVNNPNYGLLVDIGNFMCSDCDPCDAVGILAPYALHVHAKDFLFKKGTEATPGDGWFTTRAGNYLRGTVIGHGAADAAQSLATLKRSGYDGYITVEFEGPEDPVYGISQGRKNLVRFWENA